MLIPGIDPSYRRKDTCGALIDKNMYGSRSSQNNTGWEIDHIKPESDGGTDDLSNLRPLQWYNNATRSEGRLTCPIKARN
ncbi:MAG: HNH endonuclease [Candidatus Levybacteria bacterium]|nr:HNH endonuclease [Candidatus Levybacteria bacterium]